LIYQPKRKPYRNPKILKACHDPHNTCQVQLPGCQGSPTEPAHSNRSDDGKGASQKACDIFVAVSCRHCHDVLDGRDYCPPVSLPPNKINQKIMSCTELQWYHDRAIKRTIRIMLDRGVIK